MPNFSMPPYSGSLLNLSAVTTNGTSAALTLPPASSYRFTVELMTASSTTTSFNLALFSSSDAGTTYHPILAFSALTTSGQCYEAVTRPYAGIGDAATISGILPILGSTDFATNTQYVSNGPFSSQFIKARWLATTAGTVTFNLKVDAVAQDLSD